MDSKKMEQARFADMIVFLQKHNGFTFTNRGGTYRCQQHPSLVVKGDRLSWYWHSKGIGGYGIINYLTKMENMPFRQAVETVAHVPPAMPISWEVTQSKAFILPEKAVIMQLRLMDYLCKRRGIDPRIVGALLEEGKVYADRRGNVVFVGFDENQKPRFASLRGTYGDQKFRMDCAGSDKRYGFSMEANSSSSRLYIFESPIDAMSHASLENIIAGDRDAWLQDHRLSLAGTSDTTLPHYLETHPDVRELVLCLDNDPAGREAATLIARKYGEKGFITRIELPKGKDYNEDLVSQQLMKRKEKSKQEHCM